MRVQFAPFDMEFSFVDFRDVNAVKAAIKPNTKLIFSETPTNPQLRLVDLEAVSKLAKEIGGACLRLDLRHAGDLAAAGPRLRPDDPVPHQVLRGPQHLHRWRGGLEDAGAG